MILTQNYTCGIVLDAGHPGTTLSFRLPMNQFFETYREVFLIKIRHILYLRRNEISLAINDGDTNAGALRQLYLNYSCAPLTIKDYEIQTMHGHWFAQNTEWISNKHYDTIDAFLRMEHDTRIIAQAQIDMDVHATLSTTVRLEIQYFFEVF